MSAAAAGDRREVSKSAVDTSVEAIRVVKSMPSVSTNCVDEKGAYGATQESTIVARDQGGIAYSGY